MSSFRKKKTSRALVTPQEFSRSISVPSERIIKSVQGVTNTPATATVSNYNSVMNCRTPMSPTEET